jgi:hypothetical protein
MAPLTACAALEPPALAVGAVPVDVDTRDGAVRYAAYAGRTAQIMQRVRPSSHVSAKILASPTASTQVASLRYLAYASDLGEAFRPTVPRWVVNATYGVAFGCDSPAGMRQCGAGCGGMRRWLAQPDAPASSDVACDVTNQTVKAQFSGAPPEEARSPTHPVPPSLHQR